MQRTLLFCVGAGLLSVLYSCNKKDAGQAEQKAFTQADYARVKTEVSNLLWHIRAVQNSNGQSRRTNSQERVSCASQLAYDYNTTCFNGMFGESLIQSDQNTYYAPVHTSLANDLDLTIQNGFSNNYSTQNPGYFSSSTGLTSATDGVIQSLGNEQASLAQSLENNLSISDSEADNIMVGKIQEQEQQVMNNPSLSYEDKEYIISTLEIERQSKDSYMAEYAAMAEFKLMNDRDDNQQQRRRSFFGKLWRGLAFVAITLATAGKAAVFIAKAAYIAAGKSAVWAASAAALKKSYFALGIAAAWVPTGAELVNKQKWNYDPWGSGSFSDVLKFGSGIIGVVTNPLFGWAIV